MNKKIKILLVDDHDVVRRGLQQMLNQEADIEIVGQCDNGEEAISRAEKLSPNIILMDIKMPVVDGIEATRRLSEKGISCDVIMLSMFEDYLGEAMEAGARGYLIKDIKREELVHAIREVYRGEIVFSNSIAPEPEIDEHHLETIELVIPPSPETNATQLLKFLYQVEKILNDNYNNIMQVVGSWDRGTAITLKLRADTVDGVLNQLTNMPSIKAFEEITKTKSTYFNLAKKMGSLEKSRNRPSKRIHITLKESSNAKPAFTNILK